MRNLGKRYEESMKVIEQLDEGLAVFTTTKNEDDIKQYLRYLSFIGCSFKVEYEKSYKTNNPDMINQTPSEKIHTGYILKKANGSKD